MSIENVERSCGTCEFNRGGQEAKDLNPKVGHCAIIGNSHPVRNNCHIYIETTPAKLSRLMGMGLLPTTSDKF